MAQRHPINLKKAGFTNDQIIYHHNKMESKDSWEIEKDTKFTPPDVSPRKVAYLTEKGE